MGRGGVDAVTDHHAAFGPVVGAGAAGRDARHHRAVAGQGLVGIAELVGHVPDIRAGAAHADGAIRRLGEPYRPAVHVQGQVGNAIDRPVLGGGQRQVRLGIVRRVGVVIVQRHRLLAAVDDRLLAERRVPVADGRGSVRRIDPAVEPGLVDARALTFFIIVALEVIDHEEIGGGEAPDHADPRAVGLGVVDLVDAPEVGLIPLQCARLVCGFRLGTLEKRTRGIRRGHGRLVVTEVDLMPGGLFTRTPHQDHLLRDVDVVVLRIDRSGPYGKLERTGRDDRASHGRRLPAHLCHGAAAVLVVFHTQ